MYKRDDKIEEEKLDWENQDKQTPSTPKEPPAALKKTKRPAPTEAEHQTQYIDNRAEQKNKLDLKKNVKSLYNANVALFSIAGILFIPYLLGFVVTYFLFAFYGGMSISGFVNIEKAYLPLQLWTMGAYMFITAWVVWAILNIFTSDE